ncbi:SpoIID/LytB domain-containing protein [Bacteroides sp. 51]|uniref:SpoIID/LytB domain-containing protein n=1 Tax=Bacteroides sp. 51 TaxID=2302938 RepID=UPI0013CF9E66|nr:SpoIID/LytB domain-containing protein [Bacteroides sp. 51]NDV81019.1 SpoIID/LytB domain-containing protein [Bacteroides sp. 51]
MIEPKVNVGILFEPRIDFILLTPYVIDGKEVSGEQMVSYSGDYILWQGRLYEELLFEPTDESQGQFGILDVTIGINFHWERKENQRFQGAFKVIVEGNKLTGINIISVEDYLTSVISSEMSATASLELLKAHAVISRSWLLASLTPTLSKGEGEENATDIPITPKQYYHTANCTSYDCLKEKQKELKNNPTEAERIVWNLIRDNQSGEKFRRQHIIADYIVDFICLSKKLIIEIDGEYHNNIEQIKKDNERTSKLNLLGFKVLRFTNNEVIANPESIIRTISNSLSFGEGRGEAFIKWYERSDHTRFDVCADDHCQRYQGITRASTEIVKQAINATRGQILSYDKKICDARFSKCCGGAFEEFQNCWEDIKYPYLAKQRDSKSTSELPDLTIESEAEKWIRTSPEAFCNTTDKVILSQVLNNYDQETVNFYRWKVEYSQKELSELIHHRSGIDFGDILDLIPIERGTSGRLVKLKIVGTKRTLIIGKELEIRRTLSTSHLYSSAFVVDKSYTASPQPSPKEREQAALSSDNNAEAVTPTSLSFGEGRGEAVSFGGETVFTLTGAGWGHGVGLCQIGAAVMGEKGYPYNEILLHYYIGASIEKLYE